MVTVPLFLPSDKEVHEVVSEDVLSLKPLLVLDIVNCSPVGLLRLDGCAEAKGVFDVEGLCFHGDGLHVVVPEVKERRPPRLDDLVVWRPEEVQPLGAQEVFLPRGVELHLVVQDREELVPFEVRLSVWAAPVRRNTKLVLHL